MFPEQCKVIHGHRSRGVTLKKAKPDGKCGRGFVTLNKIGGASISLS